MIDLDPIAAEYAPRPKRKYTVAARALAARRANPERAEAVPRKHRVITGLLHATGLARLGCRHMNRCLEPEGPPSPPIKIAPSQSHYAI